MALPYAPGLTPNEVAFLAEMELVTVIPRQKLDRIELLGGPTERLNPPFPAHLPLWLALLLKRQKRANIQPPPWLTPESLSTILDFEIGTNAVLSPHPRLPPLTTTSTSLPDDPYLYQETLQLSSPFLPPTAQDNALPYHWMEVAHLLLTHAADDFEEPEAVRRLLQELREARMSKLRKGFRVLEGGARIQLNGVGAMEVAEVRGFVGGVVDGLRRINKSREETSREREDDDRDVFGGAGYQDYDDDAMEL